MASVTPTIERYRPGDKLWPRSGSQQSPASSPPPSPPTSSPLSSLAWRRNAGSNSPGAGGNSGVNSGNWRTGNPPKSTGPTGLPQFSDLVVGTIAYLPSDSQVPEDSLMRQGLTSEPWDHPCVVLQKLEKNGEECVRIRLLTSFGNTPLEEKKPPQHWQYYLLAENKKENVPVNGTELLEVEGSRFSSRCYVNFSAVSTHTIEYRHVKHFAGGPVRFKASSMKTILAKDQEFSPPRRRYTWPPA